MREGRQEVGHLRDEAGWSITDQFEEAWLLFEEIREIFEPAIEPENLFIVPGNHDINRSQILEPISKWLHGLIGEGWEKSEDRVTAMIQKSDNEWQECMKRLVDYRKFLQDAGYDHLLEDPERLIYGTIREVGPVSVGIAGLNSAWSCAGDHEKGGIWLGGKWQIQTLEQKISKADLKIGLMHHPINWFTEVEDPSLGPLLERSFHFFLHGHEHQNWVHSPPGHTRIAGGAAYDRSDEENGYNLVRLNWDNRTGEVWLRKYDNEGGGWIPRTIFERADNGIWLLENIQGRRVLSSQPVPIPPPEQQSPDRTTAQTIKEIKTSQEEPASSSLSGPESRGIFGRANEIDRVSKYLLKKSVVTVYGLPGIGKSDLIGEVRRTKVHEHHRYVRLRVNSGLTVVDLYRDLAAIIGAQTEAPLETQEVRGRIDFSFLASCAPEAAIIHLEQAQELFRHRRFAHPDIGHFFLAIIEYLPQINILLESREEPPQGLFPEHTHKATMLRGLGLEAMQAYFRRPFKDDSEKGYTLSDQDAQEVYRSLGGDADGGRAHPLAMFLLATVAEGRQETPIQVLQRHRDILVDELEKKLFIELYDHVLSGATRHMLRLCALYRDGVPDTHADRLNHGVDNSDAFDSLIRRCLMIPNEASDWYYLHHLIGELTNLRTNQDKLDELDANHELIAELWLSQVKFSTRPSPPNIRAASEAAYHFIKAESFDRLAELSGRFLRGDVLPYLEAASLDLHRTDRHRENIYVLELLVTIDPGNHKAHRFLGEALERINGKGNQLALQHYEEAYALNPIYPQYLANLGRCYLARETPEHYVVLVGNLEENVRQKVMDEHNQTIYSNCLTKLGRGTEASQLRQAEIERGTQDSVFYADEATYLAKSGDTAGALTLLDQADQRGAANAYTLSIRAKLLEQRGQGAQASQLRQAEIERGTQDSVFYADEATYLAESGDTAGALTLLDQANQRGMANAYTLSIRAKLLEQQGQGAQASQLRQAEIERGTQDSVFYADEATYLAESGDTAGALTLLDQANQRGMANAYTLSIRAKLLEKQGQGAQASQLRQAEIERGTRNPALYHDEATYLAKSGDTAGALTLLDQADQRGAANAYTLSIRAKLLEQRGQGVQASQLRQAEIERGTRNPVFYHDEAIYLAESGDTAGALALLDQADQHGMADSYTLSIRAKLLEQ